MQLDKSMILDLLRSRGEQGTAEQADRELPDQVDTDRHSDLLGKLGLDPQDLIKLVSGGGGLGGGIGGLLGGR